MNIRLLQLVTGEQIIADVDYVSDENYVISNPQILVMEQQQNGMIGIKGMVDYLPYGKMTKVKIKPEHVVYCVEIDPRITTAYQASQGKLVTPQKPGLILPS